VVVRHVLGIAVLALTAGAVATVIRLAAFLNLIVVVRVASIAGVRVVWVLVVPEVLLAIGVLVVAGRVADCSNETH